MKKLIFLFFAITILISHNSYIYSQTGWIAQQSGTTLKLNKVFFSNSQTGWVVGDSGKIIKTINGGVNWNSQFSNTNLELRSVYFLNENTGYASGGKVNYGKDFSSKLILKTTNGGTSWITNYFYPDYYSSLSDIYFVNENSGFAVGFGGTGFTTTGLTMKTTNAGDNWYEYNFYSSSSIQFTNANTGWIISRYGDDVGSDTGYVMKSINGGLNWFKAYQQYKLIVLSSNFINNNTGWVGGIDRINNSLEPLILKTLNGGINWQRINLNTGNVPISVFFSNDNRGWTCFTGIYYSSDGGVTWLVQIPPVQGYYLTSITFIDTLTGWAVGENGKILKTTTGGLTSIVSSNEITPDDFLLNQNYPNPFNPKTIISYQLAVSSNVSLKVYDVLGNEVLTLVNEKLPAGQYEVKFDGTNYSSGVYFYKIQAGNFIQTKRMVLVK